MNKKIVDLQDNDHGEMIVLIKQANKGFTAKQAIYLNMIVQDNSGQMDAKYWNIEEDVVKQFPAGTFAKAKFHMLIHQKHLQMRIDSLEKVDEKTIDIHDYVISSPLSKKMMQEEINAYIEGMHNKKIQAITLAIVEEYADRLYDYPAAMKNHHDYAGGLAMHIIGMLKIATSICEEHASLNRDLLYAGIILHDIGKIDELSGAIVTEYTKEGKLLGHISIMQAKIYEKANQLGIDGEEVLLLRHMILSHHGKFDYGSPVLPMIIEAEVLHLIDNLDARIHAMEKALNTVNDHEFTQRIFPLENRMFYRHHLADEEN